MSAKPYSRDQKCVLALGNRSKPKSTLERMSEGEKDALAVIWDEHGKKLGPDFVTAFDGFWAGHAERYNAWLESNKASDAEAEEGVEPVKVRPAEFVLAKAATNPDPIPMKEDRGDVVIDENEVTD